MFEVVVAAAQLEQAENQPLGHCVRVGYELAAKLVLATGTRSFARQRDADKAEGETPGKRRKSTSAPFESAVCEGYRGGSIGGRGLVVLYASLRSWLEERLNVRRQLPRCSVSNLGAVFT